MSPTTTTCRHLIRRQEPLAIRIERVEHLLLAGPFGRRDSSIPVGVHILNARTGTEATTTAPTPGAWTECQFFFCQDAITVDIEHTKHLGRTLKFFSCDLTIAVLVHSLDSGSGISPAATTFKHTTLDLFHREEAIGVGVEAVESVLIALPFSHGNPAIFVRIHNAHSRTGAPSAPKLSSGTATTPAKRSLSGFLAIWRDSARHRHSERSHGLWNIKTRRAGPSLIRNSSIRTDDVNAIGERGVRVGNPVVDLVKDCGQRHVKG